MPNGSGLSHARCEARRMRRFKGCAVFPSSPALSRRLRRRRWPDTRALPCGMIRDGCQFRPGRRGSLGVWLRLADLAARLRLRRTGAGQHHRDASFAVRLFVRSSRHARTPRPRPRPRFRRRLPRHRLSRGAKQRAATLAYLRGREQTTAVYRELVRGVWLEGQPDAASRRYATPSIAAIRNTPAGSPRPATAYRARATADPATTATM